MEIGSVIRTVSRVVCLHFVKHFDAFKNPENNIKKSRIHVRPANLSTLKLHKSKSSKLLQ